MNERKIHQVITFLIWIFAIVVCLPFFWWWFMQIYAATFWLYTDICTCMWFHYQVSLWKIYLLPPICIGRQYMCMLFDGYIFSILTQPYNFSSIFFSVALFSSHSRTYSKCNCRRLTKENKKKVSICFGFGCFFRYHRKSNTTSIYIAINRTNERKREIVNVYRSMICTGQSVSFQFYTNMRIHKTFFFILLAKWNAILLAFIQHHFLVLKGSRIIWILCVKNDENKNQFNAPAFTLKMI